MNADATMRFLKFDGSRSWTWPAVPVSTDESGIWLFMPAGTPYEKPGSAYNSRVDCVMFVPFDDWWCVRYYDSDPSSVSIYVDVISPVSPDEAGSGFDIVDLDLDVLVIDDVASIDDEVELEEHAARMNYPDSLYRQIVQTADRLMSLAAEKAPPFDRDASVTVTEIRRRLDQ